MMSTDLILCQWLARCTNPVTLTMPHPVFGNVPSFDGALTGQSWPHDRSTPVPITPRRQQ